LEDDTFKECGRSDQGGSIYVSNNGANFVIVNSESIKSHATNDGLFLYSRIDSALKYNFVLYSTISESYYTGSGSPYGTIIMYYGQIRIISTNSSNNVCYYDSSFALYAYDNSASSSLKYSTEDGYIHYCYAINNYAKNYCCIWFNSYIHKCEDSNIINNSQGSSGGGILNEGSYSTITINKCCLIKNSNLYLFWVNSGTMEVRDCTIQSGYSIRGSVTTSYSNTVAGSECAAISNCGANIGNIEQYKCKCSVYDNMLINNLYRLYVNKPFLL
jgi:hypothetical protein